jgi:hypothetical protein
MTLLPFFHQKSAKIRQFERYISFLDRTNTSRDNLDQTCKKIGFFKTWPGEKMLSTNQVCDVIPGTEQPRTQGFCATEVNRLQPRTQGICSWGAKYPGMAWSRDPQILRKMRANTWVRG